MSAAAGVGVGAVATAGVGVGPDTGAGAITENRVKWLTDIVIVWLTESTTHR